MEKRKRFNESVFHDINQLAIYVDTLGEEFFKIRNVDITHEEFMVMDVIDSSADICQRDLAKIILRDRVRTGRILTSLEKKGYIERYNDVKNNRLVRKMKLTRKGRRVYEEQYLILEKVLETLLQKFSQEQMNELKDMLFQLRTALTDVVEFQV